MSTTGVMRGGGGTSDLSHFEISWWPDVFFLFFELADMQSLSDCRLTAEAFNGRSPGAVPFMVVNAKLAEERAKRHDRASHTLAD
mmetsp:Transcript_25039/g.50855  ORF Transcript_25039/g.50855 Transcript_25039/m.50855 type:complete len:85 (-) Transcript_25039:72-326(-)